MVPRRWSRRNAPWLAPGVVALIALVLTGCTAPRPSPTVSASISSSAASSPRPTSTTAPPTALAALQVGQCILDASAATQPKVGSTTVVPCAQPHAGEVAALPVLGSGAFPSDEALDSAGSNACTDAFATYVGASVYDSPLNFTVYTPTEQQWASGDQRALCVVFSAQGNLIGSIKGIGSAQPNLAG